VELHSISWVEARRVADLTPGTDEVRSRSLEQDYRERMLTWQDTCTIVLANTALVGSAVDRR
jgi:hypothetical protein